MDLAILPLSSLQKYIFLFDYVYDVHGHEMAAFIFSGLAFKVIQSRENVPHSYQS